MIYLSFHLLVGERACRASGSTLKSIVGSRFRFGLVWLGGWGGRERATCSSGVFLSPFFFPCCVVGSTEGVSEADMWNRGSLDMLLEKPWRLIISI